MVSIKEANDVKSTITSKFKNFTVFKIGKYKDGYLAMASTTNDDMNDPYYFVKGNTIEKFSPINDFPGFNKAFAENLIYDNHEV